MSSDKRRVTSTELQKSHDDDLGVANQHKYYKETYHELRNPAVDPRKSRRHGTDFGLGRYAESSLTLSNSDHQNPSKAISVSAPLKDNTATDGDSVSSLFECSGLDFPQPPPMGSPVIRRMRSSPWFSNKACMSEGFSNEGRQRPKRSASMLSNSDFRGLCYSVPSIGCNNVSDMVDETTNTGRARLHLLPYLDLGINDISLEMVGEALVGLDMNASNMGSEKPFLDNPAFGGDPSCGLSQASDSGRQFSRSSHPDWSIPLDLLRWSTSHLSPAFMLAPVSPQRVSGGSTLQNDYGGHAFRTKPKPGFPSEHQGIRSLGRLPRIIRKVASMKSDTRRPEDTNCIPLESTGSRTILQSRSFRSIPLVGCKAGNNACSTTTTVDEGPHQHSDRSFTNLDYFSSSKDAQDLKGPLSPALNDSLRTFQDCKFESRGVQHMPLPSSVTALPVALSGPFVHRETCNRPLAKTENELSNEMDKSFIDFTLNQGAKQERSAATTKTARVRKMIARASSGIIGWGRQLTRKNSCVK